MANIPTPQSYPAILGSSIDVLLSKVGLRGIKVGGPIAALLETTAGSQARTGQDIFQMLVSRDLDNAEGEGLTRLGADEGLTIFPATFASTSCTLGDSSFTKVATSLYQGKPAAAVGSAVLYVASGAGFPGTGSIYVGRGTVNQEGPLPYISIVLDGSLAFWTITLTGTTSRFHNVSESVVLAQGGIRTMPAGTTVGTVVGTLSPTKFTTTTPAVLQDGETSLPGVSAVCQSAGIIGNVPAGALQVFDAVPFANATVTNPARVSNGLQVESKEEFRERIKATRRSKTKGTDLAITTAVIRASPPDETATLESSSIVDHSDSTVLYIDDGTGYEEKSTGVAIESLVEDANGGEDTAQISTGLPVAKAYLEATNRAPYNLTNGATLTVIVGGLSSTLSFLTASFKSISSASAFEVVAAINSSATSLFSAHTTQSGQSFAVFAKAAINEDLLVVPPSSGVDANTVFGLPTTRVDTLRVYKNDQLLYKDGLQAFIDTTPQSSWGHLASPLVIAMAADKTATTAYTFTDADFVNASTGYTTLASTNNLTAWAAVINAKVPGINAVPGANNIRLISNLGTQGRAAVTVDLTTYNAAQAMFSGSGVITATGRSNDYTLNRNTGEIHLTSRLATHDKLAAGTLYTRAYIESTDFSSQTVGSGGARLWWVADGAAATIPTGVTSGTSLVVTGTTALPILTAGTSVFANVKPKDWIVCWDAAFGNLAGTYRVSTVSNTTLTFEVGGSPGAYPVGPFTLPSAGFAVVRTSAVLQLLTIAAGLVSPASLAVLVAAQMTGVTGSTPRTTRLRVTTDTFGSEGDIALVAADVEGAKLPFTTKLVVNEPSHLASAESGNSDHGTTGFDSTTMTVATASSVTVTDNDKPLVSGTGLVWRNPVTAAGDHAATNLGSSTFITRVFSTVVSYKASPYTAGTNDRFYPCSLFALGPEDLLNIVLDRDTIAKNFSVPLAYKVAFTGTAGYYGTTVTATNGDTTALNVPFPSYDFTGFGLYPRARAVANAPDDALSTHSAVMWRFNRYGPDGNKARISYTNPTAPSQALGITSTVGDSYLDIFVQLPSGPARSLNLGTKYAVESTTYGGAGGTNPRKVWYHAGITGAITAAASVCTVAMSGNPFTQHGFAVNDTAYVAAAGAFPAGFVTITVAAPTTFTFTYNTATPPVTSGPTVTTIVATNDSVTVPVLTPAWPGVVAGDIVTFGPSHLDSTCQGTFRVDSVDTVNGLWLAIHREPGSAQQFAYKTIDSALNFQVFPIDTTQTNTTSSPNLATRVNALAANLWVTGSLPVYTKGTVIAGSPVTMSTYNAYLENATVTYYPSAGYVFLDGYHFVSATAANANNYNLTIYGVAAVAPYNAPTWTSNEDWANEFAYLSPLTAPTLAKYLAQPTIASVGPNSEVKAASRLGKLQLASLLPGSAGAVRIAGGPGNAVNVPVYNSGVSTGSAGYVKVRTSDAIGLFSGQWVAAQGSTLIPKSTDWTTATVFAVTNPDSLTSLITLSGAGSAATYAGAMTAALTALTWQIEKHGRFSLYLYASGGAPTSLPNVNEGDWVQITSATGSAANLGIFRVVRVMPGNNSRYGFWVENPNSVEENVALDTVAFWTGNSTTHASVLPGDTLVVNSTSLGAASQGSWVVKSVGTTSGGIASAFTVYGSMAVATNTPGSSIRTIQVLPTSPSRLIKRIAYVAPIDTTYSAISFDTTAAISEVSAAGGTILGALDKLGFSTSTAPGLDGYRYNTGLVAECNRILYGDPNDNDTYPGVVAKGARIAISGPFVRRIQISLAIRVRHGDPAEVIRRVQAAVAGVVNSSGIGDSIPLSAIVTAAMGVSGVFAVTILSPTYTSGSDIIPLQSFEKPLVINLDTDVTVTVN